SLRYLHSLGVLATQKLYSYTSGRFLFNEDLHLRERFVEFNATALLQETEKILGPAHGRVASIVKLAEGGFNRVFLLNMDDGFEAILKIPFHIAGPKQFATASEAATLQYLHSKGIPVPKVYGYSSCANNPAGVEYLLMEKAQGVGLQSRWLDLTKRQLHKLATSFVDIEKKFFDLPFGSIGSIYFKTDIPLELQGPLYTEPSPDSETFCIGPTADYMFWYGERANFNLHRGPWNDPIDYLQSIAKKEEYWTLRYGKPVELDFPHNGIFPGEKNPEEYIDLVRKYLAMTPYLLPKDPALHKPTLRHPDLYPNNIFISPETGAISCIIDWQHTTVEPRLLVAGYPRAFENPDPEESPDLKEPSLPLDYDALSTEVKAEADELFRRRLLSYYYRIFNGGLNKAHLNALTDPLLRPRRHLIEWAGRQWSGNLVTLKGALIRMAQYWPHLETNGLPCPQWFEMNAVVNLWREQIGGVNEDGWVSNEQYEEAVRKVAEPKESLIALAEGDQEDIELLEKGWPFRDQEEK
ncbi:kinase-like protein, partial [Penicillium sp. DV-2018c]